MKKMLVFVLFSFLLFSNTGFAFKGDKTMTLKECISIALKKNYLVLQAQNTIELKEKGVKAAYGNFLPNLNASGSWNRSERDYQTEVEQNIGGIVVKMPSSGKATSSSYGTSISSSLTLFDGLSNFNELYSAQSSASASNYALKRTEQTIVLQVYVYYFNVLRTEKIFKQKQSVVEYSRQQLNKMTEQEKLGAVSQANVFQQQAQLASDELTLIQAESDFDKAKADLAAYLAVNTFEEYQFSDSSVKSDIDSTDYVNLRNELNDYNSLFKKAIESRPDYKSTVEAVNVAGYNLSAQKGSYYPTIGANASYGLSSSKLSDISDNSTLSYSLSISLPIFSRFTTEYAVENAQVSLKNAEINKYETERGIQVEIKKAILDLDAAYKSYISAKRNLKYQKENVRFIQEKLSLGSGTLLDLLYATNNYNLAEVSMINTTYSYLAAVKQTEYALGTLKD